MEELIKAGVNDLITAICIVCFILSTIGLLILNEVINIKIMLKKHFKDSKKD